MRECPDCGRLYPDAETTCPDDGRDLVLPGSEDPRIGQVFGSYKVVALLGQGGMGTVYLGQHPTIGSQVAIKVLHPRFAADPAVVDRFFNEARSVNLIGHENIVQIFDLQRLPDRTPYLVMEYLNGRPLSADVGRPMPESQWVPIALQIAEALEAAHRAGVVHRDLKPDNIFLVPRSHGTQAKVLDFGISKLSSSAGGATEAGVVMGTASYLSPEQAAGDAAKVSASSDVYSLGVLLYQLATGALPFEADTYADALAAHLNREPPPLPETVSQAYASVILRCLRKQPGERFQSMQALADALSAAAAQPSVSPRQRRTPWKLVAASVAAMLLSAIAVASLTRRRHAGPADPENAPLATLPTRATLAPEPIVHAAESSKPSIATASTTPPAARPPPKRSPRPPDRAAAQRPVIPARVGDAMIDVEFDEPEK